MQTNAPKGHTEQDIQARFLIVASDIHDDESAFATLAEKARDPRCTAFLYAGDLNVENYFICEELRCRCFTFIPVLGNCDDPWAWSYAGVQQPPLFRTLHFGGRTRELRIYMSHGHLYPTPSCVGLDGEDFELCITGHSHIGKLEVNATSSKACTYLNPGSPSSPRGWSRPSYAVIWIPEEGSATIELREFCSDDLLSKVAVPLHEVEEGND